MLARNFIKLDNFAILMAQCDTKPTGEGKADAKLDCLVCFNLRNKTTGAATKHHVVMTYTGASDYDDKQLQMDAISAVAPHVAKSQAGHNAAIEIIECLLGPPGAFGAFCAVLAGSQPPERKEEEPKFPDATVTHVMFVNDRLVRPNERMKVMTIESTAGPNFKPYFALSTKDTPESRFITMLAGPEAKLHAIRKWAATTEQVVHINHIVNVQGGDQGQCRVM